MRVSAAALALKVDSAKVYRLCQTGVLDSILTLDGKWHVKRASVERLKAEQAASGPGAA
jgi:hypothetical protein